VENFDEQESRIISILGTEDLELNRKTLKIYLQYLKEQIEKPCELTGIEDFDWEEYYIFGSGNKKEYEKLKKTRPSYKDKFIMIDFETGIDGDYGILVNVQRTSDKRKFTLPLADLKATAKKTKNYELLDDYSVWFVNYR